MKAARMHEYRKPLVLDDVPVPDTQALARQYGADHVISTKGPETIGARR